MNRTCGDCGFFQEKLCGVAMQSGFTESHAACQTFSTIAWKCEICGRPFPSAGLVYDSASRKLVCENCYHNLPPIVEEAPPQTDAT